MSILKIKVSSFEVEVDSSLFKKNCKIPLGSVALPITDEVTVSAEIQRGNVEKNTVEDFCSQFEKYLGVGQYGDTDKEPNYTVVLKFTNHSVYDKMINVHVNSHCIGTPNANFDHNVCFYTFIKTPIGGKKTWVKTDGTNFMKFEANKKVKISVRFNEICTTQERLDYDAKIVSNVQGAIARMYEDDSYKDLKFQVGEQSLMAHKCVVAASSSVFKEALEQDKGITTIVIDKVVDFKTIKAFVKYLYTHEIDNIEENASGLLVAAILYKVESLKEKCERYICRNLDASNVVDYMILSYVNSLDNLGNAALNGLLLYYLDAVERSGDLKKLNEYPRFANSIMSYVNDHKKKAQAAAGKEDK